MSSETPSQVRNFILEVYDTLCRSPACGFRMDSFPVNVEGGFQFMVHLDTGILISKQVAAKQFSNLTLKSAVEIINSLGLPLDNPLNEQVREIRASGVDFTYFYVFPGHLMIFSNELRNSKSSSELDS
ncbi:hypothetical protein CDAR_615031 [Caerostris darwini]|uniref:Uncharacterized protein n=1 Tax=Caerostris darwini TaxID=1538125 RepID=A0AAV4T282_9ARAC|nr:hypothetical protein CDAR_615031 [Caerostris darwini]